MSEATTPKSNLFIEIWNSFRALPLWVQLWMVVILMPINFASLFFLGEPQGGLIAFLAIFGMLPNMVIMIYDRGLSKLMAFPHLIPWTAILILVGFFHPDGSETYSLYLWALAAINAISLSFDYPDAWKWLKGDRSIAK